MASASTSGAASPASGLLDDDGYMWRNVPALRAKLYPSAAEDEFRAQIMEEGELDEKPRLKSGSLREHGAG